MTSQGHDQSAPASGSTVIKNGRIKQSLVHWCYAQTWSVEEFIPVARELGCTSIELIDTKYYPLLKQNGLECAIGFLDLAPDMPFDKGFNNPAHHDRVIAATKKAIDAAAEYGFQRVITFTGTAGGVSLDEGARNCVEGWKKVLPYAESKGITLCLEMLNSRDPVEMKGHPGYQGDHTDYCVDMIRRVGSPYLKLLFDVYHVQIMDGDIIRRIREIHDVIGHVHTAGNPGRRELDNTQEINYPPIMEALVDVGYDGYVAHEYIPTRDPMVSLREAVALCDV